MMSCVCTDNSSSRILKSDDSHSETTYKGTLTLLARTIPSL